MPEDRKLSQIGSSALPPPFRGLNSLSGSRKTLSNYFRLLFPEIVHYDTMQLHRILGLILRSRRAVDPRSGSVQEQAMIIIMMMTTMMTMVMMTTTTTMMMTMMTTVMMTTTMMMMRRLQGSADARNRRVHTNKQNQHVPGTHLHDPARTPLTPTPPHPPRTQARTHSTHTHTHTHAHALLVMDR